MKRKRLACRLKLKAKPPAAVVKKYAVRASPNAGCLIQARVARVEDRANLQESPLTPVAPVNLLNL